eukprot:2386468-Rhodomonas_salina.1
MGGVGGRLDLEVLAHHHEDVFDLLQLLLAVHACPPDPVRERSARESQRASRLPESWVRVVAKATLRGVKRFRFEPAT